MKILDLAEELKSNSYPGRGIVIGKTPDGLKAGAAYFIMGRSENGKFNYAMSILKSADGNPASCNRFTFAYENPMAGEGHFIHTYIGDGNPLPSFEGEPKKVNIPDSIEEFTNLLWENLNEENKVSLFVRYVDIATGTYETRIVNKNH